VSARLALGIDVGGSGVKAGVVDVVEGALVSDRLRVPTPKPAPPEVLAATVKDLVHPLRTEHQIRVAGIGSSAVIKDGVALTAVNISDEWCFADVARILGDAIDRPVAVVNDADDAGIAEMRFGAGSGVAGTVAVVTLGTGIGTSLFVDGRLVPNMELARMEVRGKPASERVANSVREKRKISWEAWTRDVNVFLQELDRIAWPELIVIGGGVSAEAHKFFDNVQCRPPVVPARLRNDAGIIGTAEQAAAHS
jgi:polyphosphate glucokinase